MSREYPVVIPRAAGSEHIGPQALQLSRPADCVAQLVLPGVQPAPTALQALVDAQREMIAARERFDALWSDALFSPEVLPAFVRPQAL